MTRSRFAMPASILMAGIALAGCGDGASVAEPAPEVAARTTTGAATGVLTLSFYQSTQSGFVEVSTLPVCSSPTVCPELILGARVTDALGAPATSGSVVFQYCSFGGRTNDINRPDEAPSAECASGAASWTNLRATLSLTATGNAYLTFGVVRIPRTVGFRFKYSARGGPIASGVSPARDFTWTAQ